ncbi:50S ribosomal protein L5 [Candidatus Gottesmanbacteria bacterium]|nr:50S ribosomal protein L5 [Candidatus Gottesmanbacteria bacterium]
MNIHTKYREEIKPILQKETGIRNLLSVPKLVKIVVNVGLGEALSDHKVIERVSEQLAVITGQTPAVTRAKTSIAAFKLRVGDKVGMKVTLRGKRMYDFFEKLVRIVLPRVRDFRGVPRDGFDDRGNYNLGLSEQTVFPEIEYGKLDKIRGLEITFVTTARTNETGMMLLSMLGMPFEKEEEMNLRKKR